MTEPTPEPIINEKAQPTIPFQPLFDIKKDLTAYGSQEAFDKAVQDLLAKGYTPYDTATSGEDFAVFMVQAFSHKQKALLLLGDGELSSEQAECTEPTAPHFTLKRINLEEN